MSARAGQKVVTFPRDAVLTARQLAEALQTSPERVAKMDLPCFYLGNRVRYVYGQVLDVLQDKARGMATPRPTLRAVR